MRRNELKHYNYENSPCKISDLVRSLLEVLAEHGDLPVLIAGEDRDQPLMDLDVEDPVEFERYDCYLERIVSISQPLCVMLSD
jgi:hypothetical protein